MRRFYPAFLDISGKKAVVAGGGAVAARKAAALADSGADVTIVSPKLGPEAAALVEGGRAMHIGREYSEGDLAGAAVAVAATDDPETNTALCSHADTLGIPSNSARPPSAGSFIVPSTIRRGGLTVAISTGGGCPALSKRLRKDIEAFIGEGYGPFLEFLEEAREHIKKNVPDENIRADMLTRLAESGLVDSFREKGLESALEEARALLAKLVNQAET